MTHEDFAHICLRIKDGDTSVEIPCCANCAYYLSGALAHQFICAHPKRVLSGTGWTCLVTNPEDFCSYYTEREE